jgi:rhomboid-like protein
VQTLRDDLETLKSSVEALPKTIQVMVIYSYAKAAQYFLDHSELRRTCWALSGISAAVWLAWLRPRWQTAMFRRFTHDPLSGRSYTLLTSMFR